MNKRLWLLGVCASVLAGCASRMRQERSVDSAEVNREHASKRQDIVLQAMAMLDRGYTYGGKKLHTGFDCSGLVTFVYKESAGLRLQGSSAQIASAMRAVDESQAYPGDLVFFNTLGTSFSHVGIYIGTGKFIHAANERTGVRQERLSHPYWSKRFEGYRTLFA